jgi:hypothetical protein
MKQWERVAINRGAQALVNVPGRRNTMSTKAVSDYEIEAKHAIGLYQKMVWHMLDNEKKEALEILDELIKYVARCKQNAT